MMILIERGKKQQIVIGGNITVTVKSVSGQRVTLGVQAPANCKIQRGERKGPKQ